MDNLLQSVRVRSCGNSFEKISTDDRAALAYRLLQQGGCTGNDRRQIVKDTAQARVGREDCGEK
jgi:hypothetical protein